MAKKVYEEENIRAIAEKIREKTGSETTYKTSDMPKGIDEVYEQAYGAGYDDGIVSGNEDGYNEGYEAGQQAEYDKFWDNFQNYGNRKYYPYTFAYVWTDDIYNPKYDITTSSCSYAFYLSEITDTKVPITITAKAATGFFEQCTRLKTVRKLKVNELCTFINFLTGCTALENITFEGVIGNNIDFKNSSKLTHESLMSIINALKNFVEKKTLRYAYGTYASYDVTGFDSDPKGITWNVTEATFNGTTLTCNCNYDNYTSVTFTVSGIDIAEEDVANIKTIYADVMDFNEETYEFITDVVITMEEVTGSKTLTLGTTNLAKLTDAEKKKATDKGWALE